MKPSPNGGRPRRIPKGLSGPHLLRMASVNQLVQFWYAMHSQRRVGPLPPEVCEKCGEPTAPKSRGLHYLGPPRKQGRVHAITAINDGLSNKWELWCRRCVNQASAKKVSTKVRSQRAYRGFKAKQPGVTGRVAAGLVNVGNGATSMTGLQQPKPAVPIELPPGVPADAAVAILAALKRETIDGSSSVVKVVEVEQNWRFEKGKPPVADGWKVTLANGKCGVVRPPAAQP